MAETRLKITYSVTSTTYSTQLFKTSYFSKAELEDGTELPSNIFDVGNHAYVFSATGNNVVFFTLTGNTIGDEAFEGMTRIVSADIPSTVTTLGERCFRNCSNLSAISMTSATTAIGAGAFDSTALQSVELPATALTMADRVFYGCTELTSITISAQTAPAVQQYTFHNVHTGGTLYYSAGSDYSAWLSDSPSYLGYYGWTGVEMSGDPDTGSTPDTGTTPDTGSTVIADSLEIVDVHKGLVSIPDATSGGMYGICLTVHVHPGNADVDLECTSSNSGLIPFHTWRQGYITGEYKIYYSVADSIFGTPEAYYDRIYGSSVLTITDRNSGLNDSRNFYFNPSGVSPTICVAPSSVTIPYDAYASQNNPYYIGKLIVKGTDVSGNTEGKITVDQYAKYASSNTRARFDYEDAYADLSNNNVYIGEFSANTSSTKDKYVKIYPFIENTSGDLFVSAFNIIQSPAPIDPDTGSTIHITPSTQSVSSSDTSVCLAIVAENVTFDHAQVTGTSGNWSPMPTSAVNGNNICFYFDRNQGDSRTANYSVKLYDTDGNSYDASVSLTQEAKDDSYDGDKISHPINNHYSPGMLKLRTTLEDGQVYTTGNASFNPGLGYTKQVCSPYVLYYLNSYGGWDAFVIEGTVIKKETINSYMTDRAFNNTTIEFETNKYVNEIKTNYELNTGLLSDEESANLAKNLLGSLKVYLHNLDEGWVKPVIIMDNNITYQTYQTNGKKLSQYRINVQMSQSKIRK